MRKTPFGALAAGLMLLASMIVGGGCASGTATSTTAAADGAELSAVMDAIRAALSEAQTAEVPGFPDLKSVTIKLQTEASRAANGEIGVYVLSLGSSYSQETASTLELKMAPPATHGPKHLTPDELHEALAREIHLAKVGVLRAAAGDPPFTMTNIEIDLKFVVERQGSAGAKVTLVPLGAGLGGKVSRNEVQTVTLVFGR